MCGWFRLETARASRSNRWRTSGASANPCVRTFTATARSSRVSRARYTSPIPPAPRGDTISYGPSLVPDASPMRARHYSLIEGHLAWSQQRPDSALDSRDHALTPGWPATRNVWLAVDVTSRYHSKSVNERYGLITSPLAH